MRSEPVACAESLDRDAFEREFLRRGEPVVLPRFLLGSSLAEWNLRHLASIAPSATVSLYRRVSTDPADASRRTVRMTTASEHAERLRTRPMDLVGASIRCVVDERADLAARIPRCPLSDPARHHVHELFSGVDYSTSGHAHNGLHTLLCHLEGDKDVVLYSPHDGPSLYANPVLSEEYYVSRADFIEPDLRRFPRLAAARRRVARLRPGDAIYIPVSFWHAVRGVGLSTSLSYFWDAHLSEQPCLRAAVRSSVGHAAARAVARVSPLLSRVSWLRSRLSRAYPTAAR